MCVCTCGCVSGCMCVCVCVNLCGVGGEGWGEEQVVVLIAGYNYTAVCIHNSRSVAEGPRGTGGITG